MGALKGIRIVEMDAIGPVPLCAMILADMGADVVRIARAGGLSAYDDDGGSILHRSRSVVTLDLKSADDRDMALALIERSDGLIEGFRPRVMERLGLGPDACLAINPRLVYGRMTGWGQDGPLASRAGHDINYIALTGALAMMGDPDGPPAPPLNLIGDYGGGTMFLALGMVAGILSARATGQGQVIDAAITDGVTTMLSLFMALQASGGWSVERGRNLLDGGRPFYRCYVCADGGYVAVGALEPQFFAVLLRGLGIAEDRFRQYDPDQWPEMERLFSEIFASRSRNDWGAVFDETDACVTPVLSMAEAAAHPHNVARQIHDLSEAFTAPAPAPRFSRTTSTIRPPKALSARDILARWADEA